LIGRGEPMGFNFRKSLKIAPGVRLNITKKGISSVSLGSKGARVNLGKKGTRTTVGVPGTGLSYSSFSPKQAKREATRNEPLRRPLPFMPKFERRVSILLGIGIFLMPYIFAWFTLREGYSKSARFISFGWLLFLVFFGMQKD
jgi:hypothetical protein